MVRGGDEAAAVLARDPFERGVPGASGRGLGVSGDGENGDRPLGEGDAESRGEGRRGVAVGRGFGRGAEVCLLYTSPSPRD